LKISLTELKEKYLFAWDSVLLMGVGAITGLLYILVHRLLGSELDKLDYAAIVSLLGLLNILSLPSATLQFTMTRYVSEHAHVNAVALWVTIFKRAMRKVFVLGGIALLIWIACAGILRRLLDAPSSFVIIVLGVIAFASIFKPIVIGTLTGTRRFGWLALTTFSGAFLRLALCAGILMFTKSVEGIVVAIAVGIGLNLLLGYLPVNRVLRDTPALEEYDTDPIYRYMWPVFIGQAALILLMNADLTLANRFLDGDNLAVYGKAPMIARMVLFLPQPIALAMFPRAVNSDSKILFFAPFGFALLISVLAATVISLFPEIFTKLIYKIAAPTPYLQTCIKTYAWAVLPISLIGIAVQYLWARDRTGKVLLIAPIVVIYLVLLFIFHQTPLQMIACLAFGGWVSIAILALLIIKPKTEHETSGILIISLAGAGDTLMATPLIRELRNAHPDTNIDILTMQGDAARDILNNNKCFNNHLHYDFRESSWIKSLIFCLRLRKNRYDLSFNVMPQNRFEYNLISFLIGARERLGFKFKTPCHTLGTLFLTKRVSEEDIHLADNNLRLLQEILTVKSDIEEHRLELYPDDENFEKADLFLKNHDLKDYRLIGIHPGSGITKNLALRRWPPERWSELCKLITRDDKTCVLIFGSSNEDELRKDIIVKSGLEPDKIIGIPYGSVLDSAALISKLEAFICCDTLLTHIAAAMQIPQLVIMGPTPHTSVYPYNAPHKIIRADIDCSPCYGYSRKGIKCTHENKMKCLKDITPEVVVQKLRDEL